MTRETTEVVLPEEFSIYIEKRRREYESDGL